jgi:hypothetical protein
VGIVDQKASLKLSSQVCDGSERRDVSIHREERLSNNQGGSSAGPVTHQLAAKMGRIRVLIDNYLGTTEARPVDETRVVKRVAKDDVAATNEGLNHPEIAGIPAREQDALGKADKSGKGFLGFTMHTHRPRD